MSDPTQRKVYKETNFTVDAKKLMEGRLAEYKGRAWTIMDRMVEGLPGVRWKPWMKSILAVNLGKEIQVLSESECYLLMNAWWFERFEKGHGGGDADSDS